MERVVTRVAPSPTGFLHIGTTRTALFNYLFAKHHNGKFIVRIEDTDKERSNKVFEYQIFKTLLKLGIKPDEYYNQSKRASIYRNYLEKLISENKAYISEENSKKNPGEKINVIRFKNIYSQITYKDYLRGEIKTDISTLGDFVIARGMDDALYNFAVVVDDASMGVTHIIRGDDHISNTPRQIALQKALGLEQPVYVHIPLIHSASGKLSKRKDSTSIQQFIDDGFLPETLVNYMALLGWAPKDEKEIFSLEELIKNFSLDGLQKGKSTFDLKKLIWINKAYIKKLNLGKIISKNRFSLLSRYMFQAFNSKKSSIIMKDIQERSQTLKDGKKMIAEGNYDFLFTTPQLSENSKELLLKNQNDRDPKKTAKYLLEVTNLLKENTIWSKENIKSSIWDYADKNGRGEVLWPFRYAISGREESIDGFLIAETIGKTETLNRLKNAINIL